MKQVLLFGNPNVGKTTVFNNLTNSNEKVSNFEGTTVTKKEAKITQHDINLIDVPGTYGLSSNSEANKVAINLLLNGEYDSVVDVIESTSIKNNLYLLLDLLETGNSISLILSKDDLFKGEINEKLLEEKLYTNIIKTNRKDKIDIEKLKNIKENKFKIEYTCEIEEAIELMIPLIKSDLKVDKRFIAIQYLKGSDLLSDYIEDVKKMSEIKIELENNIGSNSITRIMFRNRREFINELLDECLIKENEMNMTFMNKHFDKIALHPVGGFIIFAFVMYLVFYISFSFTFLTDLTDQLIGAFADLITTLLTNINTPEALLSFVVDGVIGGVGGVLVFIPQIIVLFALLTILESSGYLVRVNVLFENLFNKLGISVHSLIPYISGLGCNIFGIVSTKVIENEKHRIATILTIPFISCSARLPIYIMFIDIFFDQYQALILLFLYFLGILVAIVISAIISKYVYKVENTHHVISVPKYSTVDLKYLGKAVWAKIVSFIKKAGTLILAGSMVIWLLTYIGPSGYTTEFSDSFMFHISSAIDFIFAPLGFGNVVATSALMTSFLAKELAVSTFEIIYSTGQYGSIETTFTALSSMSFMIYSLLFIPCLATLGAIYSELRDKKYVIYSVLLSFVVGYIITFIIYNLLRLVL